MACRADVNAWHVPIRWSWPVFRHLFHTMNFPMARTKWAWRMGHHTLDYQRCPTASTSPAASPGCESVRICEISKFSNFKLQAPSHLSDFFPRSHAHHTHTPLPICRTSLFTLCGATAFIFETRFQILVHRQVRFVVRVWYKSFYFKSHFVPR